MNKHFSDSALNSYELRQLRQIARLCPYNDGIAVYQARRVLHEYGNVNYSNACEISQIPNRGNSNGQSNNGSKKRLKDSTFIEAALFDLFPNPTTGELHLNLRKEQDAIYQFELRDILGKTIVKKVVMPNQLTKEDLSDMQSGVYFYRLFENERLIQSDKIILNK